MKKITLFLLPLVSVFFCSFSKACEYACEYAAAYQSVIIATTCNNNDDYSSPKQKEIQRARQAAHEWQERRHHEEKRRTEKLETLNKNFHALHRSISKEREEISYLQKKLLEIKTRTTQALYNKEKWQNDSKERAQTISTLNKKLTNITEEYRQKELSLKPVYGERIANLFQETDSEIKTLQKTQIKEAQSWRQSLAQATAGEQDLQSLRDELESSEEELLSQIEEEENNLTELVTQKIRNKQASTKHVLKAIESLDQNKEIFHAIEHAHNVPLMIALILSGHFKTDDLSSAESNYETIPKRFFRETRLQLLQAPKNSLKEEDFHAWNAELTRLGQKKFLCCSC